MGENQNNKMKLTMGEVNLLSYIHFIATEQGSYL